MKKEELIVFLEQKYSKADTLFLTKLVSDGDLNVADILVFCSHKNPKVAFRASWLLEHVADFHPQLFKTVVKDFLTVYHLQKNESAQRCFSKIAMGLSNAKGMKFYNLNYPDLEDCLSASFDWLLNEETPVAIKCNCMDVVYQLHKHEEWIESELKTILERHLISNSPALLSRTKRILQKINKTSYGR